MPDVIRDALVAVYQEAWEEWIARIDRDPGVTRLFRFFLVDAMLASPVMARIRADALRDAAAYLEARPFEGIPVLALLDRADRIEAGSRTSPSDAQIPAGPFGSGVQRDGVATDFPAVAAIEDTDSPSSAGRPVPDAELSGIVIDRAPRLMTFVEGDSGYWETWQRHVRIDRTAPGEIELTVKAGEGGIYASLTVEQAADLAYALLALVALEPEPSRIPPTEGDQHV